jgi:hypothetical protein
MTTSSSKTISPLPAQRKPWAQPHIILERALVARAQDCCAGGLQQFVGGMGPFGPL